MSKDEKDTHLRYGQGILIQGYKEKDLDLGFLTAKGFADIKAKYQTYDDILYFKNYRNAIFQMLPAGNFQINDQLQKALIQNEGKEQTPNIKILKARAKSEETQFSLNIQNKKNNSVCFGNSVIFKHIDSESYISGTIRPSSGSNGAFIVQVSNNLSQSLIFKLLPYRSFQFIGMQIPYDSPIILKNEYNNGFLTFEKLGLGDGKKQKGMYIQKKPIESDETYKIPVKTQSETSTNYECVTHFVDLSIEKQVPMPWKFVLHFKQVDNDSLIQHDIVYLQHTQNQGVLSMNQGQIVLKEMKQTQDSPGLRFYECLWQIQKHDSSDDAYILRHLMSGQTLGIKYEEQKDENNSPIIDPQTNEPIVKPINPILIDISQGAKKSQFGVVQLKLAKKQGGQINSDSYINVAWKSFILETDDSSEQNIIGSQQIINNDLIDRRRMARLLKHEVQFKTRKLVFTKNDAQMHCFVIQEIDDDLKKNVLFALSFHSVIINLREDLKWGAIEAAKKIDYFRMMKVTEKIYEIKDFLKNVSHQQAELEHIFPVQKNQMICKDLGISQLLFQLLFYMKMNIKEDIFSDKHNEKEKFLELYNTIYEVIRQLIRKNRLFKMHVSKWIMFVFEDVINNNESSHLKMLKELLNQNNFFVNNFVTEELLKYLTQAMLQKMHDSPLFEERKYLQILRLFCIAGQTVNTANQILIYNTFITSIISERGEVFAFKLSQNSENQILIKAAIDKNNLNQYPFKEFYQYCKEKNESAWQYFVEYLNLIADMTQGRNKVTEQKLAREFSLELLTNIFENQELAEAEVPMLRILHYLYAESENFYPVERQKKIVNYENLNKDIGPSIISTPSNLKPWQPPFDRVLRKLVQKISNCGPIDPTDFSHNKTVFQLMNFIWETLNLGFWRQKDQVRSILASVLKILQKHESIKTYDQVKKKSIENALMIKCKQQCLKIIELIADYDKDLFVQTLTLNFKDFEMPVKKRGLEHSQMGSLLSLKANNQISINYINTIPGQNEIQPLIETNIVDQMMELANYDNAELTSMALSIAERVLQTKKKAIEHFSGQRYICDMDKIRLVEYIDSVRNSFFILQDPNLVNIDKQSQFDNYFLIYEQGKSNNLMTTLYNLSELMKNENELRTMDSMKTIESSLCYEYLGADKLLNFTMQRSSTSQTKQNIVFCSNLHPKVLNFIFNCKQIPESELAKKLLHLCYKFIVALIENYNQIKVSMVKYIPKLITHISKNVGCVDFLKEMYDNNKNMLYNQSQVFSLIKFMCDIIEGENIKSYYKSKLLDFFRYLIYCNGRSLKFIQIQILKIMQDDTYKDIMLKNSDLQRLPDLVKEYQRANLNKKPDQLIEMSPELTYMMTFFQISASLIDDNNTVNMGKIIKKFPFDKLVKYILLSGTCWPLKRNIRTLLNRLYYFQPQIQTNLKSIIEGDFVNIIKDLNIYIQIKVKENARDLENMLFQSPVRFSFLQSYLYLNLEQIFFTIFQLVTRDACIRDLLLALNSKDSEKGYLHAHNFIRICQRLGWIRTFFTSNKNVYSNSMLKFIIMKLKVLLESLNDGIFKVKGYQAKIDLIDNIVSGQGIDKFFQDKSRKVDEPAPLVFSIPPHKSQIKEQRAVSRERLLQNLRKILKRQKRQFNSDDQKVNYYMNKLINSLKLSPKVTEYFFEEFNSKVSTYTRRQDIYQYITTIITMNSNNPEALPSHLKVFFLELITFIVEESNKPAEEAHGEIAAQGQGQQKPEEQAKPSEEQQIKEKQKQQEPLLNKQEEVHNQGDPVIQEQEKASRLPIDEWQPENWESNQPQIRKTQNRLKNCDLSKFIVDLLKENITEDVKFANSILLCAISYLLGGNNQTQKSIIEELSKDEQNKVFRNIQTLIENLGKLILKNITENVNEEENRDNAFCPTTIDNYDFFDVNQRYCLRKNVFEPNSTDEYLYHKLCIKTYRRTFKFLQLLCENNNIQGKNFIREQPGKQRQINFINVTTKELRNLFQVMCSQIIDVPIFLLDFVLQVTQIPVKENQQALMRSTFFEDLCQMESFFGIEGNKDLRNLDDLSILQPIYFKSVQIILSNFEGNNEKTFNSLDSKLQPRFLINIIHQKLKRMDITKTEELVSHINEFCNKEDEEGKKNTTFSEELMECLNIMVIFAKMKDKLENCRLRNEYEKFKRQEKQRYEEQVKGQLSQSYGSGAEDNENFKLDLKQKLDEYKCLYSYLQKCIIKIQITDNNNQQQTIYFPKYPVFNSLSGNLRDYVMSEVERSTHRDKIVTLLAFTSGIKDKIEYSYNLQKKEKITQKNMNDSYNLAALFSIIICIYMMFFYNIIVQYQAAEFTSSSHVGSIKFALSLLQLAFSLIYTYYWYKLKIWYKPQKVNRKASAGTQAQDQSGNQAKQGEQEAEAGIIDKIKGKIYSLFSPLTERIKALIKALLARYNINFEGGDQQEQKFYQTGEFARIAMFVICSIIGTFFYPIFFFIHLIDIFCRIQVLANIFEAVAVNIKSLLYVSFMGVVFVFVFCTVTFSNYMKNVYAQGQGVDDMCDDVLDCVMSLYVSGAIGQTMESFQLGRFTYDMIYITFFGLLFGNIVQGIMLDAFAGLREKNDALEGDKSNTCYICNMPREVMEKKGQYFSDHTRQKHFLWNYVFYIIALERKSSNDYTGLEYQISQKYNLPDEEMDVSWVPSKGQSQFSICQQASKLSQKVKENNSQLQVKLKDLQGKIDDFNKLAQQFVR